MAYGYWNKVLRVNLTDGTIGEQSFTEEDLRKYTGGSGLAVKILSDETDRHTDPLGPDNRMIFMTGPFTGTGVTNGGRYQAVAKSPLTGILGEANSGGSWGTRLKGTGYDGIVFEGKAEKPVYLFVEEDKATLMDASIYWGMDTFQLDDELKAVHGNKACTLSIGPAGENLVRFAAIMNDGYEGRAAGRCGLGAVMGSKNLKCVTVLGNKKTPVADSETGKALIKKWAKRVNDNTVSMRAYGTTSGIASVEALGDLPIKNWSMGSYNVDKLTGEYMSKTILAKHGYCAQCALGCARLVKYEKADGTEILTGGPEYETVGMLGTNLLIDDLVSIQKSNEICNKLGLDTISAGSAVSFLFEAYENGLVDESLLDGIKPTWGNSETVFAILEKIAYRKDIGDLLADGTRAAAVKMGGIAPEFAVHVKGLEFPAHDPRASDASGLAYATSTRGACHLNAFTSDFMNSINGFGFMEKEEFDRFDAGDRIVNQVVVMQNVMAQMDSLTICKFVLFGVLEDFMKFIIEWYQCVVGWNDMTIEEFLKTGERIFNLKRAYLVENGISRKDDVMPPRMTKTRGTGSAATNIPDVAGMLDLYYAQRGWDMYGRPTAETYARLDLK